MKALAAAAQTRAGARSVYSALRKDLRADELARLPDGLRGAFLHDLTPLAGRPPRAGADGALGVPTASWGPTIDKLDEALRRGAVTPSELVERAFAAARDLAGRAPGHTVVLSSAEAAARVEAAEATLRRRRGEARSPLDGVPFVVKEQCAVLGLRHQNGTDFVSDLPATADAACVAPLRAAGAIVLGTSPMTEIGMSPIGQNRLRAMPKNPHAPGHVAGGSSTGSGVAVATGVVPFAIGVDGGGSIRIPAGYCGIFGLKPTWGRVGRTGTFASGSMSHVGPLAQTTRDLARVLELIGQRDESDTATHVAPPLPAGSLERALGRGVRGLRIGVEEREWADAAPEVAAACREALAVLEREGATLVPMRLELARFAVGIGALNIGPEAFALYRRDIERYAERMGHDVRISFAALGCVSSAEFLDAQRLRTGFRAEIAHAFADVDLMAMPTTANVAPAATDAEMSSGFVDGRGIAAACRYAFLANLTGLPAGTAPVGRSGLLPIGFQLVGDAWDEATVLAALAHLERVGLAQPVRPAVAVDLLG